jgi:chromosome segregation ATPase
MLQRLCFLLLQLDHARASLDQSFENETRLKQDADNCRREVGKLQDKVDQLEAEMRRVNREKEQMNAELNAQNHLRSNDIEKLELEITQLNTERDQLVRQLEKSQDMLLTFQQE